MKAIRNSIIAEVQNQMILDEVKRALQNTPAWMAIMDVEDNYLESKAFEMAVLFHANDLGQSINQIIAHFKKINGIK